MEKGGCASSSGRLHGIRPADLAQHIHAQTPIHPDPDTKTPRHTRASAHSIIRGGVCGGGDTRLDTCLTCSLFAAPFEDIPGIAAGVSRLSKFAPREASSAVLSADI